MRLAPHFSEWSGLNFLYHLSNVYIEVRRPEIMPRCCYRICGFYTGITEQQETLCCIFIGLRQTYGKAPYPFSDASQNMCSAAKTMSTFYFNRPLGILLAQPFL